MEEQILENVPEPAATREKITDDKPLEIIVGFTVTNKGYEVTSIGGHFPGNSVAIRGLMAEATELILVQLMKRQMAEDMKKPKIVAPGMMESLRMAGKKIIH